MSSRGLRGSVSAARAVLGPVPDPGDRALGVGSRLTLWGGTAERGSSGWQWPAAFPGDVRLEGAEALRNSVGWFFRAAGVCGGRHFSTLYQNTITYQYG